MPFGEVVHAMKHEGQSRNLLYAAQELGTRERGTLPIYDFRLEFLDPVKKLKGDPGAVENVTSTQYAAYTRSDLYKTAVWEVCTR